MMLTGLPFFKADLELSRAFRLTAGNAQETTTHTIYIDCSSLFAVDTLYAMFISAIAITDIINTTITIANTIEK